jgi:hypothetical protein
MGASGQMRLSHVLNFRVARDPTAIRGTDDPEQPGFYLN